MYESDCEVPSYQTEQTMSIYQLSIFSLLTWPNLTRGRCNVETTLTKTSKGGSPPILKLTQKVKI